MRIARGLAFVGLAVGAFMVSSSSSVQVQAASSNAVTLDRLFASDAPETIHEAKNQGTIDEPKASWPEANAWLHARLSDTERDFLAMSATGTPDPNGSKTAGLTTEQINSMSASIAVTIRFAWSAPPGVSDTSVFLAQLQKDVGTSLSTSSISAVTLPTSSPVVVGLNLNTLVTFSFLPNGQYSAGAQLQEFILAFINSGSTLRKTVTFDNLLDLSYFPSAVFSLLPTTAPTGPTASATPTATATATASPQPTTAPLDYCASHQTACLNGGTCLPGLTTTAYSCVCNVGYIGPVCQFSLLGNRRTSSGAIPRGKSITRPNANANAAAAVKPHSA